VLVKSVAAVLFHFGAYSLKAIHRLSELFTNVPKRVFLSPLRFPFFLNRPLEDGLLRNLIPRGYSSTARLPLRVFSFFHLSFYDRHSAFEGLVFQSRANFSLNRSPDPTTVPGPGWGVSFFDALGNRWSLVRERRSTPLVRIRLAAGFPPLSPL